MYRPGGDFHPWENLEPQLSSLLAAKGIGLAPKVVAVIINRGGLSDPAWKTLIAEANEKAGSDLMILDYNPGPLAGEAD